MTLGEIMKKKHWYPVVFMFVITACASLILIGLDRVTREKVRANEQLMLERAVLDVFPDMEKSASAHALFQKYFQTNADGVYEYLRDGAVAGYAVPVAGQGFWAPIRGIIGVSADLKTFTGASFYDQSETPGLGARILEDSFTGQFKGLVVGQPDKLIAIRPPASGLKPHEIHGITGATQTCLRLEKLINSGLSTWLTTMKLQGVHNGHE